MDRMNDINSRQKFTYKYILELNHHIPTQREPSRSNGEHIFDVSAAVWCASRGRFLRFVFLLSLRFAEVGLVVVAHHTRRRRTDELRHA